MLVHRILRAAVVALTLCAAAAVALLVTLPADSVGHTATLADLPAVIGGSIVTEQGEPLAGVTVTVVALAGGAAVTTTTDLDGSYRFTVTAAGDYVVAPSLPGRYFTPPDRTLVIPPDYLAADFIGAASPATLSFSGRTQTDAGAPIVGATVWAHAATGEVFTATSAANGAFVVGNVITGAYVLRATAQTHYFAVETSELAVPPSQADILLVGEPYATIRGVVRDGSAAPIAAITVTAELTPAGPLSATLTDVQGAYTLTQLTAGLYRITPVHANYRFTPVWRELMTPPDADAVDFVGEPHFVFYLPFATATAGPHGAPHRSDAGNADRRQQRPAGGGAAHARPRLRDDQRCDRSAWHLSGADCHAQWAIHRSRAPGAGRRLVAPGA